MSMRWLGLFLAATLYGVPPAAGEMAHGTVTSLLRRANGSDPAGRIEATRELLRRGPAILPELERAGAKPMRTISPVRGDVVYSLLKGDLGAGAAPDSFGLHLDAKVTAQDVERMGRAHGFRLMPGGQCRPGLSPACYVHLLPGRRLAEVLREVLTTEPHVTTVSLNYVER